MRSLPTGTGIWSSALRYGDPSAAADAAAELESLGYTALWLPDVGGDLLDRVATVMAATSEVTVATGILNIWMHEPDEVAARHADLVAEHGDRFLVGLGVSHSLLIDMKEAGLYRKPLTKMRGYLDGLDAAPGPPAVGDRVLAALGPKMLELAGSRASGTHPYLVTIEGTAAAREALGATGFVGPEVAVVLETDPAAARAIARTHLAGYVILPNYSNNWRRLGFGDDDFADGGSDRLVDALVAWGDEATIKARIDEHRAAGADHVCVQVLTTEDRGTNLPLDQWRRLAPVLT